MLGIRGEYGRTVHGDRAEQLRVRKADAQRGHAAHADAHQRALVAVVGDAVGLLEEGDQVLLHEVLVVLLLARVDVHRDAVGVREHEHARWQQAFGDRFVEHGRAAAVVEALVVFPHAMQPDHERPLGVLVGFVVVALWQVDAVGHVLAHGFALELTFLVREVDERRGWGRWLATLAAAVGPVRILGGQQGGAEQDGGGQRTGLHAIPLGLGGR